jgi:hypothetical protein
MVYDHNKQYRCHIVRGKALSDLDNLLPAYANILAEICPCSKHEFTKNFNTRLSEFLSIYKEKTLNNHRTEIAGKLFGMYFENAQEEILISDRTLKLLEDSDQPAFFKDLCAKYQFPSGMSKINTIIEQMALGINVRQLSFLLKILLECSKSGSRISKKEAGYYVLNSLDVLTGQASPEEVISQIAHDRKNKIPREIVAKDKASSFKYQHINEQINLLVLANVIILDGQWLALNHSEMKYIEELAKMYDTAPAFDFYKYDLSSLKSRKQVFLDWGKYFSRLSDLKEDTLSTTTEALHSMPLPEGITAPFDTIGLGDDGEAYIYTIERKKIENSYPRLVNKIKKLGKIKGLGYDIQSVYGEGLHPEFAKYIEVKSTKRVTPPENEFQDTINLTRNEWTAAQQHKEHYYIYRVYFCKSETKVFVIPNPFFQNEDGSLQAIPLSYRVDFTHKSGSFIHL